MRSIFEKSLTIRTVPVCVNRFCSVVLFALFTIHAQAHAAAEVKKAKLSPVPSELLFRWPLPSRATVIESTVKRGVKDTPPITAQYDIVAKKPQNGGYELPEHYRHTLEALGNQNGLLGLIFNKSQNKFQHPAKLRRPIWNVAYTQ